MVSLLEVASVFPMNCRWTSRLQMRIDPFGRRTSSRCIIYVPVLGNSASELISSDEPALARTFLTDAGISFRAFPVHSKLLTVDCEKRFSITLRWCSICFSCFVGGLDGACSPPKIPETILCLTGGVENNVLLLENIITNSYRSRRCILHPGITH